MARVSFGPDEHEAGVPGDGGSVVPRAGGRISETGCKLGECGEVGDDEGSKVGGGGEVRGETGCKVDCGAVDKVVGPGCGCTSLDCFKTFS